MYSSINSIYSNKIIFRYGDEIKNCSLLATFSAIITKFTIFNSDENSQEKLNYIY